MVMIEPAQGTYTEGKDSLGNDYPPVKIPQGRITPLGQGGGGKNPNREFVPPPRLYHGG